MDSTSEAPVLNQLEQPSSSETVGVKTSKLHVCYVCGKMFSQNFRLKQHIKIHSEEKPFQCEVCSKAFQRKSNLKRHMKCHKKKQHFLCGSCGNFVSEEDDDSEYHKSGLPCPECLEIFCTEVELKAHTDEKHASEVPNPYTELVKHHKRKDALNVFSTATFDCCEDYSLDIFAFLNSLRRSIENELKYQLHEKKGFKWNLMLELILTSTFQEGSGESVTLRLDSNTVPIFNEEEVSDSLDIALGEIMKSFEDFFEIEFVWTFTEISKLDVLTAKYNPF